MPEIMDGSTISAAFAAAVSAHAGRPFLAQFIQNVIKTHVPLYTSISRLPDRNLYDGEFRPLPAIVGRLLGISHLLEIAKDRKAPGQSSHARPPAGEFSRAGRHSAGNYEPPLHRCSG